MTKLINKSNYKSIYQIALFAILFFVAISILNKVLLISFHSQFAELINTSGKQRMLSQRISLLLIQYDKNNQNNIEQYINEIKTNYDFIKNKDLTPDLNAIYHEKPYELDNLINTFINSSKAYIKYGDKEELEIVLSVQNTILEVFEEVVLAIENESKKFSDLMVLIEILIFLFIAILLFLESKFIFKPMLKKIDREKKEDKRFRKKLEKTVEQKTKKLQESLEIINHYVFTSKTDANGIITYVSDAFSELTGYSKHELIGKNHNIIKHPDTPKGAFTNLWETVTSGQVYQGDVKNMKKNGEEFWLSSLIRPEWNEKSEIIGYIAYRKNITHEKTLEEMNEKLEKMVNKKTKELLQSNHELKKLSETDTLTGIYNRKKLKDILSLEIKKASRYREVFSIILLDIDHFKEVNDTYGHLAGDKVLVSLCDLINENIRDIDLFARWGGEEFIILVHNQNISQSHSIAEKLRKVIESQNIENLNITCSFGVTQYEQKDNSETIFKKADDALYLAKEKGRNCVQINY